MITACVDNLQPLTESYHQSAVLTDIVPVGLVLVLSSLGLGTLGLSGALIPLFFFCLFALPYLYVCYIAIISWFNLHTGNLLDSIQ